LNKYARNNGLEKIGVETVVETIAENVEISKETL
jgi:hypothetical protein